MEQIASFQIDHTLLQPGLYLSRQDGDIATYDLRFCRPNTQPLLSQVELHSVEHLLATVLRNSSYGPAVVYFGPMGCQTGFYLLLRGLSQQQAIDCLQQALQQSLAYQGGMPGCSPKECGNYRTLDLAQAKQAIAAYAQTIAGWTPQQLAYPHSAAC